MIAQENFDKITKALKEYKDAQYDQIQVAINASNFSLLERPGTNIEYILKRKALSCNADAELQISYSRVFIAAANLVEALEEAGFIEKEIE